VGGVFQYRCDVCGKESAEVRPVADSSLWTNWLCPNCLTERGLAFASGAHHVPISATSSSLNSGFHEASLADFTYWQQPIKKQWPRQVKWGGLLILAGVLCFGGMILFHRTNRPRPQREPTKEEKQNPEALRTLEEQNKVAETYNKILERTGLPLGVGMGGGFVLLGLLLVTQSNHERNRSPNDPPRTRPAWYVLSIFLIGTGAIAFLYGVFELWSF
jgi:hypothetical protein